MYACPSKRCCPSRGDPLLIPLPQLSSTRGLQPGRYYDTRWTDVGGAFNSLQLGGGWDAPSNYANKSRLRWTVRVLKIRGNVSSTFAGRSCGGAACVSNGASQDGGHAPPAAACAERQQGTQLPAAFQRGSERTEGRVGPPSLSLPAYQPPCVFPLPGGDAGAAPALPRLPTPEPRHLPHPRRRRRRERRGGLHAALQVGALCGAPPGELFGTVRYRPVPSRVPSGCSALPCVLPRGGPAMPPAPASASGHAARQLGSLPASWLSARAVAAAGLREALLDAACEPPCSCTHAPPPPCSPSLPPRPLPRRSEAGMGWSWRRRGTAGCGTSR
jgi:hypothetical protein